MSVKINGKKLHLTTFEVETTVKNVRACLKAQKTFAELSIAINKVKDDDDQSILDVLTAQENLLMKKKKFLKKILHLSDAQVDKIEDSDPGDVSEFVTDLIGKNLTSRRFQKRQCLMILIQYMPMRKCWKTLIIKNNK